MTRRELEDEVEGLRKRVEDLERTRWVLIPLSSPQPVVIPYIQPYPLTPYNPPWTTWSNTHGSAEW